MNRRGLLGFLAGGAVAGPAMVKEAVGAAARMSVAGEGMSLGALVGGGFGQGPAGMLSGGSPSDWAKEALGRLIGKTAADIAREKLEMHVHTLDGDIASMRSLAWHAKIAMQKDRDYERNHHSERRMLERVILEALNG